MRLLLENATTKRRQVQALHLRGSPKKPSNLPWTTEQTKAEKMAQP